MTAVFAGVQHGERPIERPEDARHRMARLTALREELARVERELDDAEPLAEPGGHAGAGRR